MAIARARATSCWRSGKDKLIRPGMSVIDLGAAPGGWSQVTSRLIGGQGRLIASDILEMDSIPDVTFIQGDFTRMKCCNGSSRRWAIRMWTL